jgi:hypothetical protein
MGISSNVGHRAGKEGRLDVRFSVSESHGSAIAERRGSRRYRAFFGDDF